MAASASISPNAAGNSHGTADAPEVHSTANGNSGCRHSKADQPWTMTKQVREPGPAGASPEPTGAAKPAQIAGLLASWLEIAEHQGPGCASRASKVETIAADGRVIGHAPSRCCRHRNERPPAAPGAAARPLEAPGLRSGAIARAQGSGTVSMACSLLR